MKNILNDFLVNLLTVCFLLMSATAAMAATPMISAGNAHALALKDDGTVWAWGDNTFGELGNGTSTGSLTPIQVQGLSNVVYIAAGGGSSFAVKSDGTLWAWGYNNLGQLGIGNTQNQNVPVQVAGISSVVAVATSMYHTLALTSFGTAYAWGDNQVGELGTGNTTSSLTPVLVSALSNVTSVQAGSLVSSVAESDGSLWLFGLNQSSPSKVNVTGISNVTSQSMSTYNNELLIGLNSGSAWSWVASNNFGVLGNGSVDSSAAGWYNVLPSSTYSVSKVAVGFDHAMAILKDGTVLDWGQNAYGQLGNSTTQQALVPAQVPGLANIISVAGGQYFSVALRADGSVFSWGENVVGQLGDGTTTQRNSPVQINLQLYTAPQTGWWWDPNDSGMGFTIEKNAASGRLFMAGYLYDSTGRASWYGAGAALMTGSTFTAPLIEYSGGQTLTGAYQAPTGNASVGNVSITFTDSSHGTLTWPGGTIPIQRFDIVTGGASSTQPAGTPEAGWWWDSAQGGRGFSIEIQNGSLFMAGYMYDASGNPIWYASGPAKMLDATTYQGTWQQYGNGITLTGSYKPSAVVNSNVGTITLQFTSTTTATLALPDGSSIALIRYRF